MKKVKKILCLLLALVLVVGTVLPNIKAKAEDTGAEDLIQEIKAVATRPLYEDRNFDTRNDWSTGEMRQYRYYFESYANVRGTVVEKNGDVFRFNNMSDLYHRYGFYPDYESNQSYNNQWGPGKHTATLKFMGKTCDFEVELKKNPVQNIEAKYHGVVVEGGSVYPDPGKMEFIFTFTDGTKESFHRNDNVLGEVIYSNYEPLDLENGTWSAGKHYWKTNIWNKEVLIETDVKKISDSPIKSISVEATNPLVPEWHTQPRYDYETGQLVDCLPVEESKPEITVTYHDGSTVIMGYEQLRSTYPEVEAELKLDNDSPEGFGKRTATLSFYGQEYDYVVDVTENPTERISAVCTTPYLEGYTQDLYDVLMNCEVYITVYFKDGSTFTGTQEELYDKFGADLSEYPVDAVVGKNVEKIEYMGKTCDLEFEVIPNPYLKKVVSIDAKVKGDVYCARESYSKSNCRYEHLLEVTLTYDDGTTLTGTPEEINKKLSKYTVDRVEYSDDQIFYEWKAGKHFATVRYQMLETEVEFEVKETPYTKAIISEEKDGLTVVLEQENASPETYKVKKYHSGIYNGYDWNLFGYFETDKGILPVEARFAGSTSHDYSNVEYMLINGVRSNSLENCKWIESQVTTRMQGDAPAVTHNQSAEELKQLVLTKSDYQDNRVDGVVAWLEIADKTEDVSAKEQQLLDQATSEMDGYQNGIVVDLTVYKQFPSDGSPQDTKKARKLKDEISITMEVPEEILASTIDPSTIKMIRIHNGETQVLPCVYDAATKTITFETDSFSTYALAYQTSATSGGTTQGGGTSGGGTSGETAPATTTPQPTGTQDSNTQGSGTEQKVPLTGDNHRILVYFMLCAVSLMTLVVGKKKEF